MRAGSGPLLLPRVPVERIGRQAHLKCDSQDLTLHTVLSDRVAPLSGRLFSVAHGANKRRTLAPSPDITRRALVRMPRAPVPWHGNRDFRLTFSQLEAAESKCPRLLPKLPTGIPYRDHNRFLVDVHSDIFNVTTHVSCLLGGKVIRINAYLSPKVKVPFFRSTFLETDVNHPESAGSATVSFNLLKRGVLS